MPPTSQDDLSKREASEPSSSERVVISGIAGLYPGSKNIQEFSTILYNKINPITSNTRWNYKHPEVCQYAGNVPELHDFDAQFFKVHYRLGISMDAMARKILEQTYAAIYDAGLSPEHLSGKKVGVYIGTCYSETEKACFYVANNRTGFGIAGCSKTMFANRISYWLNTKGPSMSIDNGNCSSLTALEAAHQAISQGLCEAAIVGGSNLCLHPQTSINFGRVIKLSMDGNTRSFDSNANGCVISEAINVLFLQKARDALRIYADVIYVKTEYSSIKNDVKGPRYGFYRDPADAVNFLKFFYKEAKVNPQDVQYVEAFGSAEFEADKAELESIDEVFCANRKSSLLIGSVMSNIGYGEAASGISSITKVILGYHYGTLAANLHCDSPRQDVAALREGRIQIMTNNQSFDRTYSAVNNLSLSGINAHVLLNGHHKPKDLSRYQSSIPHLVLVSARQQSDVQFLLDDLKCRVVDPEELALLNNIHSTKIFGHLGRGFMILETSEENGTVCLTEKVGYFDEVKRPLWFVYSGMGSQWVGMGVHLMRIPVFAAAIERCRKVLEPRGIDIVQIITTSDKTIFDNILNSFVGIAAIQIGLTDVLRTLNIHPDNLIGHSVGELGCAYADGCFTAEEMILSAYSRGLVSVETPFIRGSMAAVGLGYQEISKLCPPEIEVACHNGPNSSTLSGPKDKMKDFVTSLTDKNIFAKEVPCSNIAYHSRYIAEAGPKLLKYLSEVIKNPKPRSERWVSTSVPQDRWSETAAKYSSAEYHTNNLLSPVLFEETSKLIPPNALVIEIAPHGLLQAILKRSLPESCYHVPMTRRNHPDGVRFLLEAIGKLYMQGCLPKIQALYPKIDFPVTTGTPMLSHLVRWAHHEKWPLPLYNAANRKTAAARKYIVNIHDDDYHYLSGHIIKGQMQYPFAAALEAVWDTLAMSLGVEPKKLSVQFQDVHLLSQLILHDHRPLRLNVTLQRGTGSFEVTDDIILVAKGYIFGEIKTNIPKLNNTNYSTSSRLNNEEIYQLLHSRDYGYKGVFRSIFNTNLTLTNADIIWNNNWVTLIDSIFQLHSLRRAHSTVSMPSYIGKLVIDVNMHESTKTRVFNETVLIEVNIFNQDSTRCGGMLMENIQFLDLPMSKESTESYHLKFVPFYSASDEFKESTILNIYLQIVAENNRKNNLNILEIADIKNIDPKYDSGNKILNLVPGLKAEYSKIHLHDILESDYFPKDVDCLLITNMCYNERICKIFFRVLKPDTFIINKEDYTIRKKEKKLNDMYHVVSTHKSGNTKLELALWRPKSSSSSTMLKKGVEGGDYYVPVGNKSKTVHGVILKSGLPGDLNSLHWVEFSKPFGSGVIVNVHCAGVNINNVKGIMNVQKISKQNNHSGSMTVDFSGTTDSGARVMGVTQSENIASCLKVNSNLLWPVPEHWSLEDAATVPLAYSMAFYALYIKSELLSKHSILVHGGTGALGQAIISIALAFGCEVFTTVSNVAKKQFLLKLFPELKEDHIGNTREISFSDKVRLLTHGRGCDIVIICSKGILRNGTYNCCSGFGIIIDTVLLHNYEDHRFGMNNLNVDRSYVLMNFSSIFEPQYIEDMKQIQLLMSEGIARGYVRPLTRIKFGLRDVSRAFQLVSTSRHRGRVLLDFNQTADILPRFLCSFGACQVILSDDVIFGIKLAHKIIEQGASKIFLYLPKQSNLVALNTRFWQERGVQTKSFCGNITDESKIVKVLKSSISDGFTESVFVVLTKSYYDNEEKLVGRLSEIVENLSILPKCFAVLKVNDATDQLAAAVSATKTQGIIRVNLPAVLKMDNEDLDVIQVKAATINSVLDSLEKTLSFENSVMITQNKSEPPISLLQQLMAIAGINLAKATNPEATLRELDIDLSKLNQTMAYLYNTHRIWIPEDKIPSLTLEQIENLDKYLYVMKFNDPKGLKSFYECIEPDELLATTEMIFLPTLSSNSTSRDDEFDANQSYLCIVPGIEGVHPRFQNLCEGLKLPAVVLQPGLDNLNETLKETAQRYTVTLLKKIKPKHKFYLLGYESGVMIALEMAAILESKGLTGTVFCLGGSPGEIKACFEDKLSGFKTDTDLQLAVVRHMYSLFVNQSTDKLDIILQKSNNWKDRINACLQCIHGRILHSNQYARNLIEAAYVRILQVQKYQPQLPALNSVLVSLKPRYSFETKLNMNLNQFSQKPIISYELKAPLAYAAQDLRCTAIINRHLDIDIQKLYKKRNLCETYLLNADSFMTGEYSDN